MFRAMNCHRRSQIHSVRIRYGTFASAGDASLQV